VTVRFDPAGPERFRDAITRALGLTFEDAKLGFLGEVLKRRADARGEPVEVYLARIEEGPPRAEVGPLAEELTVNETYFFRNNDQFNAVRETVLPDRMKARGYDKRLSILSAGCSSGEEPYTLAILTREAVDPTWQVSIKAIDLNPAVLASASAGRYSTWSLRDTDPDMLSKWFTQQGKAFQLAPEIMDRVSFEHRNLASNDEELWKPAAYDVIFCRNVIMYFSHAVQQEVIGRMVRSLVPGGYLFLGHAETLRGLSQDFHLIHTHNTFYYQRKSEGEELEPSRYVVGAGNSRVPMHQPPATLVPGDTSWFEEIGNASKRIEALLMPSATPATAATAAAPAPHKATWSLTGALDLMQRERFDEALDAIKAMPAEAADDPDVLLVQSVLLAQSGKLAAAVEVCRVLLIRDELNAGANYVLGLCFEAVGNVAAADAHYRAAGYIDPQFAMPFLHLGVMARRAGNLAVARRELEQARDLLVREDASRLLLFGGGFTRDGLLRLCAAELAGCEVRK
jgi:chemotaxis protein methyltransferase CheR